MLDTSRIRIPVTIEIEPQRIIPGSVDSRIEPDNARTWQHSSQRGLRAQLADGQPADRESCSSTSPSRRTHRRPSSITTGPMPIIPSVPATLDQLQASATTILNKIAKLPVEELLASLTNTAGGLERIVNSPDLQQAGQALGPAIAQLQQTISRINGDAGPLLGNANPPRRRPPTTLRDAQTAIASIQRSIGSGSALTNNAENLMQELTRAARSIRVLADYLERNPAGTAPRQDRRSQ